jgi:hypothetical protein
MKRNFVLLAALMLSGTVVLAGCGDNGNPPSTCHTDADCDGGKKCDTSALADGESAGTCVDCVTDKHCEPGNYCNPASKTCEPRSVECEADADCAGKDFKFCSNAKKCEWGCKENADCGATEHCIAHQCEPRCSSDAGCPAEKPRCDRETHICHACLSRSDCAEGQVCLNNACVPEVCDSCSDGQVCFNGEICVDAQLPCSKPTDCTANEVCVSVGAGFQCHLRCNPAETGDDERNPSCWGGYGLCLEYDKGKGICLLPPDSSQDLLEACQDVGHPESESYNDCKPGLYCQETATGNTCWKACDASKNDKPGVAGPNPACETGSWCTPDGHGGAGCDPRLKVRQVGETCDGSDPAQPDFHHCTGDNICVDGVCEEPCFGDEDCLGDKTRCELSTNICRECLSRRDCGEAEACVNYTCVPSVCDTCTEGQVCHNGVLCVDEQPACEDDEECGPGNFCVDAGAGFQCFPGCDLGKNASEEDMRNPSCWGGLGWCMPIDWEGNAVCVPPAEPSQGLNETCYDMGRPGTDGYNECQANMICMNDVDGSGKCWKACDVAKNEDPEEPGENPDCATGSLCIPDGWGEGACDPRLYVRATGEVCDALDPTVPEFNHCLEGNTCLDFSDELSLCAAECDPEAETSSCAEGYACESVDFSDPSVGLCIKVRGQTRETGQTCEGDDPRTEEWDGCINDLTPCLDGVCGKTRTETQLIGELCEQTDQEVPEYNACVAGLTCFESKCTTACEPGAETNACAEAEHCYEYDEGKGACVAVCDTMNGVTITTDCAEGEFCAWDTEDYKPGICAPLPKFEDGKIGLGDLCIDFLGMFCDGSQELFCNWDWECAKACDPRVGLAGNPACPEGQECWQVAESPLGGECRPAGKKELGEACSKDVLCKEGLFCDPGSKECQKVCNPGNGVSPNPTCDETYMCQEEWEVQVGGYCKVEPLKIRNPGETCLQTSPDDPGYHDCVEGQKCNPYSGVCEDVLPIHAECGGKGVCDDGTECVGSGSIGKYYCLALCTVGERGTCPDGFECLGVDPWDWTVGTCFQTCSEANDCTAYGTVCENHDSVCL